MTVYRFNKETKKIEAKPGEHPSYVQFHQIPRSFGNGKHRRTSPKAHGDPTDRAGAGAGRAIPGGITYASTWPLNTSAFQTSASVSGGGGSGLTITDYYAKLFALALIDRGPRPPTLPYAGVRSGEIIGHRAWWVLPEGLCSLAHRFIWKPGATIEGDLNEVVHTRMFHSNILGGVYAYDTPNDAFRVECMELIEVFAFTPLQLAMRIITDSPALHATGLVRGTVKLWGEVIEHELGWRAQYAKLASIEEVFYGPQHNMQVDVILRPYRETL